MNKDLKYTYDNCMKTLGVIESIRLNHMRIPTELKGIEILEEKCRKLSYKYAKLSRQLKLLIIKTKQVNFE